MTKSGSLLGGILLVAGTCIGGGMLALPVLTGLGGFIPSLVIYLLCWAFMACTGLLFLEVCHWMKGETNMISMAEKTLGFYGKSAAWLVYLFFFFCLSVAYIVGSGNLVSHLFSLPDWLGPPIFVALSAPFVYAGAQVVGKINTGLMIGLTLSFLVFLILGYQYVNPELLAEKNWSLSIVALPIAFASFGYQGIIPTLSRYFHHDVKRTRLAILIGSFIPFVTYIIWEWLILGIVPLQGPGGLEETLQNGDNAVFPLKNFINSPKVYVVGQFFAFFALATSFLGVTLGLLDFLADGLKIKKDVKGKLQLSFLVFIPPLLIGISNPHLFLTALDYAGGFGSALLLGMFPVLMVWAGRYRHGFKSTTALPGGRPLLAILLAFVLFELCFEVYHIL